MRVLVWPCDKQASGHYRAIWPAQVVANLGLENTQVEVDEHGPTVIWDREWEGNPGDAQVMGVRKPDADLVVVSRPDRQYWFEIIERLQARGVVVVCDIDDDLTAILGSNVARKHYGPAEAAWSRRCCEIADWVTVTTAPLARVYGQHGRVSVLPNLVPKSYLKIDLGSAKLPRSIGWSGSIDTHPTDLQETGGAVAAVSRAHALELRVVGTGRGAARALGFTEGEAEAMAATGWVDFDLYPFEMARLGIGIVPLVDNRFNRSKSALKLMEFAALGVPAVVSPTPDNVRMVNSGVGILASKPAGWRRALSRLADEDTRVAVAAAGREVMARFTYEAQGVRWLAAWQRALAHKQSH